MIAEETRKSRMSRVPITDNVKQDKQVYKIEESVPGSEVQNNVRSYVTHNKGGKWELIRAPASRDPKKACYVEDGCSLHLEIYSHNGELAPVYSSEKAIGLVLATGNIGKRLTSNDSQKYLYLSRDGGLVWEQVKSGVYIYEIGDHGALIIIAKKKVPTDEVEVSWD
jgi:hypothetical protein